MHRTPTPTSVSALWLITLFVTAVGLAGSARAETIDLAGGRRAVFIDKDGASRDRARFVFKDGDALSSVDSPLCPSTSELRFVDSTGVDTALELDCSRWQVRGSVLKYFGKKPTTDPSGVVTIKYGLSKLVVVVKAGAYGDAPLPGPADWVETTFRVNGTFHCGRWSSFKRNDTGRMVFFGPTSPCEVLCGDGELDAPYETCDDGNDQSGDGCSPICQLEICGDGDFTPPGEACDDGNSIDGDGCDSNCTPTGCGNGVVSVGEQCDDGNTDDLDGCRNDCTLAVCGDGILDATEQCDDGNIDDGDCCSSTCAFEVGACDDGSNCTVNNVCVDGVCTGELIQPWINEIDYDSYNPGTATTDREEFAEIAGPAGLDLGGYTLFGVEGGTDTCETPSSGLLSGPVLPGYVHWSVTLPPGTVLADDTGTGIGFLVICNDPSSQLRINDGVCDIVFPGIALDSNFKNGQLLNDWTQPCPDGMLLLGPGDTFVDAVSYEGIVPNAGPLGAYFHINPYNAGADEGWRAYTSIEKWTSILGAGTSGADWRDSGGCTDQCTAGGLQYQCDWFTGVDPCLPGSSTPGELNSGGQKYYCASLYCGDGVVTGDEQCDEGPANSDAPDATCRTDCTFRRCGDGIIDPSAAAGFPESCEVDGDCAVGEVCAGCQCAAGTALGDLDLTIVPGPDALAVADDGEASWLRINQPLPAILAVNNGSNGQFEPGPMTFTAGVPDAGGIAPFNLAEPMLLSVPLPPLAGGGRICVKVRPDYDHSGFIDCDGGSNVDVTIGVDSMGAGVEGPPSLSVAGNPGDSGAGAAVAYIVVESGTTGDNATPCEDAVYDAPRHTAITTGVATSSITNGLVVGNVSVSLSGQNFTCANWTSDSGASVTYPSYNLDVSVPVLGVQDVCQVFRLNDD